MGAQSSVNSPASNRFVSGVQDFTIRKYIRQRLIYATNILKCIISAQIELTVKRPRCIESWRPSPAQHASILPVMPGASQPSTSRGRTIYLTGGSNRKEQPDGRISKLHIGIRQCTLARLSC